MLLDVGFARPNEGTGHMSSDAIGGALLGPLPHHHYCFIFPIYDLDSIIIN